jgi:hypothetical protein
MNTEQIMALADAYAIAHCNFVIPQMARKHLQAAITELVQELATAQEGERAQADMRTQDAVLIDKLTAENKVLRDALALAKDLTTIVRMPNVEYIADAHNKAVEKIQAALTRKQS